MGICDSLGINSIAIRPISCCFVISTRGDLREEFSMADEAFALSPISARATLPGEEDYAAISEAFMETSRGRWFLTEYAKRNRNADTRMVLDAVARIEQSLAAQKEDGLAAQREAQAAAAAADANLNEAKLAEAVRLAEARLVEARTADARLTEARLAEAMAAIRSAVEAAQASAIEALDGLALNERLAPVRKGARVIREIAWRLREIGNDGRICDLIDSQVSVIEKGAEQISSDEAKAALSAAFAAIEGRIAEFGREATPAPAAEAQAASPAPTPEDAPVAAAMHEAAILEETAALSVAEAVEPEPAQEVASAPTGFISTDAVAPVAETSLAEAYAELAEIEIAEAVELTADAIELTPEAAEAHDEALLDMIAMEMGAADPFDADEIDEPIAEALAEAPHIAEPPVEPETVAQLPEPMVEPEIVAPLPESAAAPIEPPVQLAPQPAIEAPPQPAEIPPEPPREISLGSSIIASGIVRKPGIPANDPLAPIRRMSQAEKIAFFS
jgi:hypothetical protein